MTTPLEPDDSTDHIREAISRTIQDLNETGVAGADRDSILRTVLEFRLGVAAPRGAAPISSAAPIMTASPVSASTVDESDVLGKIASAMKLDRGILEYVYDIREGEPELVLSAKKLPDRKAEATKVIAQLVASARQAAGLEEWTGVGTIRGVVGNYGKLDGNNFAAAVQGIDKVCLFRGKSTSREIKVTRAGMEEIADLIVNLVGDAR